MNTTKNLNKKALHARHLHKTRQYNCKIDSIILLKTKRLL